MSVSILYYTDNRVHQIAPKLAAMVRQCIDDARPKGSELIVVSQEEIAWGDVDAVVGTMPRCLLSMYRQMLVGLRMAANDQVYMVEHDVLYPPHHFDGPDVDGIGFNINCVRMTAAGYIPHQKPIGSGCMGTRDALIAAVEHRMEQIDRGERVKWSELGVGHMPHEVYIGRFPFLDVRYGGNLTGDRAAAKYASSVPYWGEHSELATKAGLI
jgi:hypothetical protein